MANRMMVGGQAVLEGVMMRGPRSYAVAVRRPDGSIVTTEQRLEGLMQRWKGFRLFPLRGVAALIDTFTLGMKALSFSARQAGGEEDEITGRDMALSFAFAFLFVLGLFVVLPVFASSLVKGYLPQTFLRSLFEGVLRVGLFVGYIALIAQMHDIKRVFEYHGAEHETVHAYEHGRELTPANARGFSPLHVGCGTAYVMMVMIVAILLFSFIPRTSIPIRMAVQVALLPVIAALSYEVTRLARRHEQKWFVRVLMAPGLALQRLTARPPDDAQLEVAITALERVLEMEKEDAG